jgi:hypothetical protein
MAFDPSQYKEIAVFQINPNDQWNKIELVIFQYGTFKGNQYGLRNYWVDASGNKKTTQTVKINEKSFDLLIDALSQLNNKIKDARSKD